MLVAYVALCSGHRDRFLSADAWEHHRVVVALTRDIHQPGNPTYATAEPSIRYSPFMVALASICRGTGIDPYRALTGAAVGNTALLVVGLRLLLGRFGEARLGATALLTMIALWGVAPGYANSYALADLPWHQVNPSAFSFALTLILWSLFTGRAPGRWRWAEVGGCVVLATLAVLDHPMTGVFGLMGLLIFAAVDPARRLAQLALAVGIGGAVVGLCLAWPWYSFRAALLWSNDREYWYNPYILHMAVFQWCAPGLVATLAALPLRGRPLLGACFVGVLAVAGMVALGAGLRSPTFARMILPGMIFVHLPIAAFIAEAGLFSLRSWPGRLRRLLDLQPGPQAAAAIECLVAAALAYFAAPQLIDIVRQPHLGRPWMDRLRHREASSPSPRPPLERILDPVGPRETVLADPVTSWLVPSTSQGRMVAALHYELFVPDQRRRWDDLGRFYRPETTPAQRREIARRYDVRWILIDSADAGSLADRLIDDAAVVRRDGRYVLMDARRWLADGEGGTP